MNPLIVGGSLNISGRVEKNDLDYDKEQCIIRREITPNGKSRAYINDTPAPLATLKTIGEYLIDIHSQHKNLLINNFNLF